MGPETKNARPSAKKIKYNWWRPVAVLVLAASQVAISEGQSTPQVDILSNRANYQDQLPEDLIQAVSQIDSRLLGSFSISQLQDSPDKIISQSISQTPVNPQAPIDQLPTAAPDQNNDAKIQALGYSNPTPENNSQESEAQKVSRVKTWLTAAGWPEELHDQAVVVVKCESTYNPIAKNGSFKGLFGLDENWFKYFGVDPELWADPEVNARVAYQVYQYDLERNQAPWTQWDPACRPK